MDMKRKSYAPYDSITFVKTVLFVQTLNFLGIISDRFLTSEYISFCRRQCVTLPQGNRPIVPSN